MVWWKNYNCRLTYAYVAFQVSPVLLYLLNLVEESSKSSTQSVLERSSYCVLLLVLIKTHAPGKTFPKAVVRSIVETLLRFLKDKDVFIQDICCMSLCHLYYTADTTAPADASAADAGVLTGLTGQAVSTSQFIAIEVMVALSREKRGAQPVGYAAGATASSGTNSAQAGSNSTRTGTPAAETGAVAGGGGGAPPREENHLLQAAAAAAAELGVGLRLDAAGAEEVRPMQGDAVPQDYVVYSTVCKMAKLVSLCTVL